MVVAAFGRSGAAAGCAVVRGAAVVVRVRRVRSAARRRVRAFAVREAELDRELDGRAGAVALRGAGDAADDDGGGVTEGDGVFGFAGGVARGVGAGAAVRLGAAC